MDLSEETWGHVHSALPPLAPWNSGILGQVGFWPLGCFVAEVIV